MYKQGFVASILLIAHGTREWFLSSMSVDMSCKINRDINNISYVFVFSHFHWASLTLQDVFMTKN